MSNNNISLGGSFDGSSSLCVINSGRVVTELYITVRENPHQNPVIIWLLRWPDRNHFIQTSSPLDDLCAF
jgi:hypothetical protein